MKKNSRLWGEVYRLDEVTNRYMIEIALDQYADIFSEWDPAPFKRRSLDPDLELYLESSSEEIPFRCPIELYFILPARSWDKKLEEEAQNGLNNSLVFKIYLLRKELRKTNIQTLRCVVLGLLFLWGGAIFSNWVSGGNLLALLIEALIIGGWVFLWEAVSLFFFTNLELYHRYRTFKRLQKAPVFFRDAEKL